MRHTALRTAIVAVAVLSVTALVLQLGVLRPRLWPAGGGFVLSGGGLMASLAEPSPISVAVVPDPRPFLSQPVVVARVWPGGAAARAGLQAGDHVVAVEDAAGHRVEMEPSLPADVEGALGVWRQMYRLSPTGPLTVHIEDAPGRPRRRVVVPRPAVWSLDAAVLGHWLREYHFGPLAKHLAYTMAGFLIVALGARGLGAALITLAFLLMGVSDAGLLMGAEFTVPAGGPLLLGFTWMLVPLAFPVISLAVLHIPQRAAWLDRHRWVLPALWIVPTPLAVIGLLATAFVLGAEAAAAPVSWVAAHPAVFSGCFGLGMLTNIGLVAEGVHRYRVDPDSIARRRIELMIVTAVPGVLAYAILTGPPLAGAMAELPFRWPWPVALFLQVVVLASAVGVAWAVAVRRALSPRTVIRQGLQYALARRTLAVLIALPGVLLALALVRQRDQPLAAIVSGQPLLYVLLIGLIVAGLRYRDRAQQWLDRRFFRSEYDAKEILLALASRVPLEPDPRALVRRVLDDIDAALHPESAAVLADIG
ncbi:MAG: PDZ domain-containing protein, partial [Acidobacteriota bacterium]|nr:PDZ domain-containing protein [Acidobacteriota bacterium]